jgi:hypothetical protein
MRSEEFAALLSEPPTADTGDAGKDVHLSPQEVEEWLALFGEEDDKARG